MRDVGDPGRVEIAAQIAGGDAALIASTRRRRPRRVPAHRRARADEGTTSGSN
jgi:hypothetical protein